MFVFSGASKESVFIETWADRMGSGVNGPNGVIAPTHVMLVLKSELGNVITQREYLILTFSYVSWSVFN